MNQPNQNDSPRSGQNMPQPKDDQRHSPAGSDQTPEKNRGNDYGGGSK